MVCLGNICRSPMAEGVMRHKIRQHGLDWEVASAGTESSHVGSAPHKFSQKTCWGKGVDISGQRARRFTVADLDKYDKIYAMAEDVIREMQYIAGADVAEKVDLLMNELEPGSNNSVPDPYQGPEEWYGVVYNMIDQSCDAIIEKYKNNPVTRKSTAENNPS